MILHDIRSHAALRFEVNRDGIPGFFASLYPSVLGLIPFPAPIKVVIRFANHPLIGRWSAR